MSDAYKMPIDYDVEWRYGTDPCWEHPEGTGHVIARCDAPQVLIQTPDGHKFWWRADLTRPISDDIAIGAVLAIGDDLLDEDKP